MTDEGRKDFEPVCQTAEIDPDAFSDEGHLVIRWTAKRWGFGLLSFQTEGGVLCCDNECMSRRFCRTVLDKLTEKMSHGDLPPLVRRYQTIDALLEATVPRDPMADWGGEEEKP